jgi:HK97 family phage portal protein
MNLRGIFGFGKKKVEAQDQKRNLVPSNVTMYEMATYLSTSVTGQQCTQVAAMYAAMKVICDTIACLSRNYYDSVGEARKKNTDNPSLILIDRVNEYIDWPTFINVALRQKWIDGDSIWIIERDRFEDAIKLHYRRKGQVIIVVKDDDLYYYDTISKQSFDPIDVFHLKDVTTHLNPYKGQSRIDNFSKTLGKMQATDELQNKFSTNGAQLGGLVIYPHDTVVDDAVLMRQEQNFIRNHVGKNNQGKWAFFQGGPSVTQLQASMTFSQAQLIEMQQMTIEDVCRIMSVPPMKIAHLAKATYNNIEHLGIDFMQGAILPEVTAFESEWDYKILGQYPPTRLKIEIDSLLRSDTLATMQAIQIAISSGLLNVNEGRALINRPPVAGGDINLYPSNNLSPLADAGKLKSKEDAKAE